MEEKTVVDIDANLSEEEKANAEAEAIKKEEEAKAAAETVYQKELKRLEDEKRQKDGALKEERRLRKEAEEKLKLAEEEQKKKAEENKPLTAEDIDRRLEDRLKQRDFDQAVSNYTSNADEQALIRHHYAHSIRQTGNLQTDLKNAVAIANQHLVDEAKRVQYEREQAEGSMTGFQGGIVHRREGKPVYEANPNLRKAAELLDKMGAGDAKKFL